MQGHFPPQNSKVGVNYIWVAASKCDLVFLSFTPDINKFLWMVRIGGSTDRGAHIKETDYYTPQMEFRIDKEGSPTLLNCLMYKMCYYRFGSVYTEAGRFMDLRKYVHFSSIHKTLIWMRSQGQAAPWMLPFYTKINIEHCSIIWWNCPQKLFFCKGMMWNLSSSQLLKYTTVSDDTLISFRYEQVGNCVSFFWN